MNRPKLSEYDDIREYCLQLDLYCDELAKAVDKACEHIAKISKCENCEYCYVHIIACDCGTEDWKEWCLKDE